MKRSTAPWTTAIAAAAIFALPVGGWAQQTSPSTPSSSTSRPAGAETGQHGSAQEHLRQAKTALNDIPAASLTGTAKTRVAELKGHLTSLEQSAGAGHDASASGAAKSSKSAQGQGLKGGWSSEVAAADRILTELLGAHATSGATEPAGTTGTSGAAGAAKQTSGRIALDETTRAKLQEVRAHLTAFAASMGGSPSGDNTSEPQASASASSTEASSAATSQSAAASPAQAEAAHASASPAEPTAAEPTSPRPTAQAASDPAAATPTGATGGAQSSPSQPGASSQATTGQVDPDTVKRHLTAARDSLSQLTQLPAASQLTGDARTQVSQLISNFNELITTSIDWRGAHDKVEANLNTLIGDQRTDESATPTANPQGAVGTSGTIALDPAIRAKLVEMRTHLVEFEKAAAGSGASASSMPPSASNAPASSSSANTAAPSTSPATASSTSSSSTGAASAPSATSSTGSASETPSPAGTSGASASTPSPAGTSGSSADDAQSQSSGAKSAGSADRTQAGSSDDKQAGHAEAMRHIEAIEAILNGSTADKTAGTSGSASGANRSGSASVPSSLDRAQIEQIRTHLNELKRLSQR